MGVSLGIEKIYIIEKLKQLDDFLHLEEQRAKKILEFNSYKNCDEFCVKYNNELVGFIIYQINSKKLYIVWNFIFEEFRNKGFGSEICEFIENIAKNRKLESIYCRIKSDNHKSINFYFNKGYKELKDEDNEVVFIKYL